MLYSIPMSGHGLRSGADYRDWQVILTEVMIVDDAV